MPGSKRNFLFCVDLCSLFGADGSRPNAETWEAMSLEEQQAFALQTAEYYSIPAAKLAPVVDAPPAVTPSETAQMVADIDVPLELSDIENIPLEPVNSVSLSVAPSEPASEPAPDQSVAFPPAELPVDGDLGSVPQN